ncbi:MAG: choice-of-anchor V domain-containing protein, partial [Gemmatimonadaceae bacterium]
VLALSALALHKEGPPPGHTGGFGEPTCRTCHFDGPAEDSLGMLTLGAPERYAPGASYEIVVALRRPEMRAAGFQLSARYASGPQAGRQAGALSATDERARVELSREIQYAGHTEQGTAAAGDSARWVVTWVAPASAGAPVVFHVAANAANGDDSALADYIVLGHRESTPGRRD